MQKIIIILSIFSLVVLSGFSCGAYGGTKNNNPANSTSEPNAVNIQNFSFIPSTLTIKKGTTVTWTNNDSALHQIKSVTFNSSQLSKGQSFSFTFNETGTFDYSCAIHPSMLGKIIVE